MTKLAVPLVLAILTIISAEAPYAFAIGPREESLVESTVDLGGSVFQIQVTRTIPEGENAQNVFVSFRTQGGMEVARFDLVSPVVPSAKVEKAAFSESFPPSLILHVTGGADGSSSDDLYIFSLVKNLFIQSFHASYEDNYYFRRATCGELSSTPDGKVILREEAPVKVTETVLSWNPKKQKLIRKAVRPIPLIAKALDRLSLSEIPSRRRPSLKTVPKGATLDVLGTRVCDGKRDGDECSTEPMEKYRWFKVRDKAGKTWWLWERQPFETNLTCNERWDVFDPTAEQ